MHRNVKRSNVNIKHIYILYLNLRTDPLIHTCYLKVATGTRNRNDDPLYRRKKSNIENFINCGISLKYYVTVIRFFCRLIFTQGPYFI